MTRLDQEQQLLCGLWFDLEMEKYESAQEGPSTSQPLITKNVTCIHDNNPTNSTALCELWCELQSYDGGQCVTCLTSMPLMMRL